METHQASGRLLVSSGTVWEGKAGYSRALRVGNMVYVAGTTATDSETGRIVYLGDMAGQTRFILHKIEAALRAAGAGLKDVVRTRMFVTDIARWEEAAQQHGEFFGDIKPVTTMVEVSRLIDRDMLIEIEAEAYLGG